MCRRTVYCASLLIASWCIMTVTHELGHIVGGTLSGGTLVDANLLPWHLPYSIFKPDPNPLVTLWCGPILGVLMPFAIAILLRRDWMWFAFDFCLIANGMYIGTAWFFNDRYLDTPQLLEHGTQPILILIYCGITIGIGYWRFRNSCIWAWTKTIPKKPISKLGQAKNE